MEQSGPGAFSEPRMFFFVTQAGLSGWPPGPTLLHWSLSGWTWVQDPFLEVGEESPMPEVGGGRTESSREDGSVVTRRGMDAQRMFTGIQRELMVS